MTHMFPMNSFHGWIAIPIASLIAVIAMLVGIENDLQNQYIEAMLQAVFFLLALLSVWGLAYGLLKRHKIPIFCSCLSLLILGFSYLIYNDTRGTIF